MNSPMPTFPIRVSTDRRHFIDQSERPFLVVGDAPWSLIVNTTIEGCIRYLDDRRARGINTILVNLIEHLFAADPPRTLAGDEPFTTPGDFRTPNEAYMSHAERVIELAEDRGMLVILYPAFLGYPNPHYPGYGAKAEGWYAEVIENGADRCRQYGEYIGHRFGRFPNVMWSIGADRNPEDARPGLEAMAEGIRATSGSHLMTAQMLPENSAADHYPDVDWLDCLSTYSYEVVPQALQRDWHSQPTRPFFLVESAYENEHDASCLQIRRAAYWSVLFGGNGHCMGNAPIWMFGPGWEQALDSPGIHGLSMFGEFFRSIQWADLQPDLDHAMISAGRGESRGLDQVGAARSADGRLGVIYVPAQRPITVEAGVLAGPLVRVTWFDPVSGEHLPGGLFATGESAVLTSPFREDAVLLLETMDPD